MVASTTAAKYGVKNTSGRIWASPQRAAVDSTRQTIAKPIESGRAGWETPCQPRRNSSINFAMDLSLHVISGTKLWPSIRQNPRFPERRRRQPWHAGAPSPLAPVPHGRDSVKQDWHFRQRGDVWDGWTARLR